MAQWREGTKVDTLSMAPGVFMSTTLDAAMLQKFASDPEARARLLEANDAAVKRGLPPLAIVTAMQKAATRDDDARARLQQTEKAAEVHKRNIEGEDYKPQKGLTDEERKAIRVVAGRA